MSLFNRKSKEGLTFNREGNLSDDEKRIKQLHFIITFPGEEGQLVILDAEISTNTKNQHCVSLRSSTTEKLIMELVPLASLERGQIDYAGTNIDIQLVSTEPTPDLASQE